MRYVSFRLLPHQTDLLKIISIGNLTKLVIHREYKYLLILFPLSSPLLTSRIFSLALSLSRSLSLSLDRSIDRLIAMKTNMIKHYDTDLLNTLYV